MKALVTGGAGFIGSHLVDALVHAGHSVAVVDDLSRGRREQVNPAARLVAMSIADPELTSVFTTERPDTVFHQAAQIDVRRSVRDPVGDGRVNVLGTANVLVAAAAAGVRRVVFASSGGAMYGETDVLPTPEDHAAAPESPYGAAKTCGEIYGEMFQRMAGVEFSALRYANVYGPRQDPHGEAGVVGIFALRLLKAEPAVINGDGGQTRDYVYVDDVVAANLRAISGPPGAYNIGTGLETGVNELFERLRRLTGAEIEPVHGPAKAGEQRRSCLSIDRAVALLHWRPLVDLDEGLARTVAFFSSARG